MSAPAPVQMVTADARAHYTPLAGTPALDVAVALPTSAVDVLAVAESVLDAPRWACRALPGHEDWADEPPVGRWFGRLPGPGEDMSAGACMAGNLNGWWLHFQAPSRGSFTLSAAVARRREDPRSEDAVQLGTLRVDITLT